MDTNQNRMNTTVTYFAKYHHDFDVIAAEVRPIALQLGDHSYVYVMESTSAGQVSAMWEMTLKESIEDIGGYLDLQIEAAARFFAHRAPDLITVGITAGQHYYALNRTFRAEVQREREAAAAQARPEPISAQPDHRMTLDEVI